MSNDMNAERPPAIPVRPGGDPAQVTVRLVQLDGTEVRLPGRSVRYAGDTHVMVAVGLPVEYFWLRADDVEPRTEQG
ncbi:hypothetical protein ACVBEQ_26365 [Nakamurella sp. GG22]